MEQNHGRNSLLEKELKKGVVKSTAPIGLIITALGLGIVMIIGSYLIKYIRGPLPLNEVYNTEQVKNEYVTLHGNRQDAQWNQDEVRYLLSHPG